MKKSYIYAGITILIWSSMAPVVKTLIGAIPNLEALAAGSFFAALFLFARNVLKGNLRVMKTIPAGHYAVMAGMGFVGIFSYSFLYYFGLDNLPVQVACILNYLWPIMLVVFSCILGLERFTGRKALALLLSFAGVIVVMAGGAAPAGKKALLGMGACILASVCYGSFSAYNKKRNFDQNISMMVFWGTTFLCSVLASLLTENWVPLKSVELAGFVWIGLVTDATGYLLWALAIKNASDTAILANLVYFVPFLSTIFSALFLHEKIHAASIFALLLLVAGVIVDSVKPKGGKERNAQGEAGAERVNGTV